MPKHPPSLPPHRISFQATASPQELRVVLSMPRPPRALASNCLWLEHGSIGGADFAPWETSGPATAWAEPTGDGAYLYRFRVAGMSHHFVPHLAARLGLCTTADEGLTALELTGSAPVTDPAASVVTDDVTPLLADLGTYPGVWSDLGFEVAHVRAQKHELGFEIHLAEPVDPRGVVADTLRGLQLPLRELTESFANERGQPVNLAVQRKKMMPIVVEKRVAWHAFPYEVRHAHAPTVAMGLNLLAKLHRTVVRIARVRVTARALPASLR